MDSSQADTMNALAEINSAAASKSRGLVSEGCWVTAQFKDGQNVHFATRSVGKHDGLIPQLTRGVDFMDAIRKNFRANPGEVIRAVQSAGVLTGPGGGTPLPEPVGEPKSFLISGSTAAGLLRSPSGKPCASIEVGPISATITARLNELVTVSLAPIRLAGIQAINENFAKPLLPWSKFKMPYSIDGAAVPNGDQRRQDQGW
jgi:hypothetical protein